jgi:hypothetical protein
MLVDEIFSHFFDGRRRYHSAPFTKAFEEAERRRTSTWKLVKVRISELRVQTIPDGYLGPDKKRGTGYVPIVVGMFDLDGLREAVIDPWFGHKPFGSRAEAQHYLNFLEVGETREAWVNPEDPLEAAFDITRSNPEPYPAW